MSAVVVVESPAKAKTINKYLGDDFTVLASYGHIRDLLAKDGSVDPDADFAMQWEQDARSKKHVDAIAKALKSADELVLATDPDREGEAISWHVTETLGKKGVLDGKDVKRVVFNEITKAAILDAFNHPRAVDKDLVDAYLARRALDYLVGFTLSPVLWRKLPGSKSAGRVQSVALRLICEREAEIEAFKPIEYWSVTGHFNTPAGEPFTARLTHLGGKKLTKYALSNEAQAKGAVRAVETGVCTVVRVEKKQTKRNPAPPFTTSTLQQEASRKLGFGARKTMQVAQKLYEGVPIGGETTGLITYMRTDGIDLSGEAIAACRRLIPSEYGDRYLPDSPRVYKNKAKNAQEAHEAIRPTDVWRKPRDVARYLDNDQRRLYELIWKRTMACQMAPALIDQVAADLETDDGRTVLRATGSTIAFDGFLKLYLEGRDDPKSDDDSDDSGASAIEDGDNRLPPLNEGMTPERTAVKPDQHFTQPPPRYSEASLVKALEELGIGRPSTYASILSVLQERNYVVLDKRRFVPEDRGRLVTSFLTNFFERYVEYGFTAEMEEKLDDISGGRRDWRAVLREFWNAFKTSVDGTKDLSVREVLDALDEALGPHFFPEQPDGSNPRACPLCADGRLSLKLGKFGAFIGCANYPDCRFTRPLEVADGSQQVEAGDAGPKELGTDPDTGEAVTLRKGPYGPYVQRGEADPDDKKKKPKRASLPKGMAPADVDLERALKLLSLPREIGAHPETGDVIKAGLGRFGPYLHYQGNYISLKGDDDVLEIGINRAVTVIAEAPKKAPAKELGKHPADGKPVTMRVGRWGPYVQHGKTRANVPKGTEADAVTLDMALPLIEAKGGKAASGKKAAAKKKAAPKKKKAAAKKKAAPKKTAKAEQD
jgi:DNA topoisomerase-1